MMAALLGMAAFSVDYGYLLTARTDLQAAADAAALAAARELTPDTYGWQGYGSGNARQMARNFANSNVNLAEYLQIPDADIEIGRYDPDTIYSGTPLTLLNNGILDTVRVTLKRDGVTNDMVPLFFARVFGSNFASVEVTATAVLPPVKVLKPGDGILPFAIDVATWNMMNAGDQTNIFNDDGRMEDSSGTILPGNWGTVDAGAMNNSNNDLSGQIADGLRQADLNALAGQTSPYTGDVRIPDSSELGAPVWVNGDTGVPNGVTRHELEALIGTTRIIPLFDVRSGPGNTAEYHVVAWGVIVLTDVILTGALANRHLTIQRSYTYEGTLTATTNLSDTDNVQGAYAAAMLVE